MSTIPRNIAYWYDQKSRNGIPGDALNSMLQKSIRRSQEENALAAAYEMYITSPDYLEMLWKRLVCISVEDIGFGEQNAASLICTLNEMRKEFPYEDGDQALFFVHAVRYLCRCKKERTSDHIRGMLKRAFAAGYVPEIPDYAYDMHTTKGREMGRDLLHFAQEASRVENPVQDEDLCAIHREFISFCEQLQEGEAETADAFRYNCWQY